MKSKVTDQQERFAREVVRLGNLTRAYRAAYNVRASTKPETVWQAASRIAANSKVAARIEHLRKQAAEKAGVTVQTILRDLDQARHLSIEIDAPSAAVSASMGMARVGGLLKDDPAKMGDIHIHLDALLNGLL